MITFLMEMLELPNFRHMDKSTVEVELRHKKFLKKPDDTNFGDMIKFAIIFIKTTCVKTYVLKFSLYLCFLI